MKKMIWEYVKNVMPLFGFEKDPWIRIVLNQAAEELIAKVEGNIASVLEISGNKWEKRFEGKNYRTTAYPEFDICENTLGDGFDLIIAEQVFEHLPWPYRASKNIYKMLNPNGFCFVSTPFLVKVHPCPEDYSRWTEAGLRHLFAEAGFEFDGMLTGSWGNRQCVKGNWNRWMPYNRHIHSLRNEPDYPVVVWILAQKGAK